MPSDCQVFSEASVLTESSGLSKDRWIDAEQVYPLPRLHPADFRQAEDGVALDGIILGVLETPRHCCNSHFTWLKASRSIQSTELLKPNSAVSRNRLG